MKVLIHDSTCAFLTPGGKTTHAHKLKQEIGKLGVDIDFARWWDGTQSDADVIHFLDPSVHLVQQAKERGIKTFFSMIFDFASSLCETEKAIAALKYRLIANLPRRISNRFGYWNALPYFDRIQFMHKYDQETALRYFPKYIDGQKTVLIPHAYDPEDMFISDNLNISEKGYPEKYLVSCANISERKRTLKLARLAKKAKVPIVFMGSRNLNDPYFKAFEQEVDNKYVFYPGYVSREWRDCIERNASGYVLLSLSESGCIAVYEAAGYKLPLLLSNLPWAWGYDKPTDISFCDADEEAMAVNQLKEFYCRANRLDHKPFNATTWSDVAKLYVAEYTKILGGE